jgi:predicted ATPase
VFREVLERSGAEFWQNPFDAENNHSSGDERSRLVFETIAAVLRRICARTPLVLAIRGADHLDRLTFDLLIHFAYDLYDVPLLCVMFARSDRLNLNCEQELTLKPLEEHEVRHQLVMLLRGPVSDATIRFFADKSGGNAFYVSELARVLLERGHLMQSGRQWRVSEHFIHERRGQTVEEILGETLDKLPEAVLEMLREASIAGGTFWEAPLVQALGRSVADLIALGIENKLIALRPECRYPGVREYGFRQDWMQRRFYRELDENRRNRGHAIVARWLQSVGDGTLGEAALIASHFDRAGLADDAAALRERLAAEARCWERPDAPSWFAWPDDPRSGLRTDD